MASIYDKASLVMIPSGTKTSKIFSQKPVSGDGDFTFSRSTAATRVNADGVIEKETQNLLLQSNSFLSSWVRSGYNLTSGQSGYDGSNDAWLAECISAGQALYQTSNASGVSTFSMHLKQGTANYLRLRADQSADAIAVFDLSDGSVHSFNGNVIDTNVVDLGSGWYRCSITWNIDTLSNVQVRAEDGNGSPILGTFYIQDAQLEQGLVARDYIETTTTAVEGGITDNVPRLDYTDASCPALLLEPQRSNSIQHSEYFGGWNSITNVTLNHNDSDSPEGVSNATEIVPNTSNDNHFIDKSGFNRTSGEYITTTIYAKASGYDYLYLSLSASRLYGVFDISNGAVMLTNSNGTDFNNDSGSIESVGNGWYRCTLIGQAQTSFGTYLRVSCAPTSSNTHTPTFAGDGTSGVLIYGAQVELNSSYATSYIPTYGSAVTRNADNCEGDSSNYVSDTSGSLFWQGKLEYVTGTDGHAISMSNAPQGSGADRLLFYINNSTGNYQVYIQGGGSAQYGTPANLNVQSIDTNDKLAMAWSNNDFAVYVNGTQAYTSTSGSAPTGMDYIQINEWNGNNANKCQTMKALYFAQRLTNEELADLTS